MVVASRTQFLTQDTLGHLRNRETSNFCSNACFATLSAKFDYFFFFFSFGWYYEKDESLYTLAFYNYKILNLFSIGATMFALISIKQSFIKVYEIFRKHLSFAKLNIAHKLASILAPEEKVYIIFHYYLTYMNCKYQVVR